MLTVKRKNLVLGMLVVLLVITGYLNFVYNQNAIKEQGNKELIDDNTNKPAVTVNDVFEAKSDNENSNASPDAVNTSSSGGFFVEYRFERENTRKKEIDYIKEIVDNPNSEVEMKNEAQQKLLEITSNMEKELNIEGLLKAKGFNNSIVIFNQDYVSVIVDKQELAPEEVAQILDIVKQESGKEADSIKIIPTSQ
ncbi:MAG: SpoIIIAH-like family protein [Caldicoprobacterales bacterium]|jgi:stage III sporulation protein AH|nr:SpoIIIAH-like family protein [Clostridiales bacterium]